MALTITSRWRSVVVSAFLLAPLSAYSQTALTGAIQFSTNSSGGAFGGLLWNTFGGDSYYDLWLAQNPDATLPVNGPSDNLASINIPLEVGNSYRFHIFGQPGPGIITGFNGLNLFFDGNSSTPGISAVGATNHLGFLSNGNSTLTLQGTSVAGSGRTFYSSGGIVVVLSGYGWNTPAIPPGDVCQAFVFSPGGGPDYFGSFALQVWRAATLNISQASGSPGSQLTITGNGFAPIETVDVYANHIGSPQRYTATTDSNGSFTVTAREPQHPYGPMDVFAVGQSSGKLGAATLFVTPGIVMKPVTGVPGGTTAAEGLGFGVGEAVDIYWNNPRQLLGTATANSYGSFLGYHALTITIPADASPGINGVIGFGQTTRAIGIGVIYIQ